MPLSVTWRHLATPGSSIAILARFFQIEPTLRKTERQRERCPTGEDPQVIEDKPGFIPVQTSLFDRVSVPTDSLARHGCLEQPGPGEKTYENRTGLLAALPSVRSNLHDRCLPP